ncbi:hypothetical protein [Methylosinus sp. Ce-a6]|uniref:hypothetical protein n=1 Tax=Methylosinus sp. Ce-a6 TaxID=2172005 RepID=UPI0013571267|nr:hypothetical protein [Methylosinus sp. Ce-a6]
MADVNSIRPDAVVEAAPEPDETIAPAPAPATEEQQNPPRRALARIRALIATPPTIDISRVAAIVVVPVFCWVFFTTSSGMIDIMRRESSDLVGVVGAIIGTSAILVMLAATSWSLGADLGALIARRQIFGERMLVKTSVTASVYLFVFSISAFFSFTYYYTNIFRLSSKKMVAELQPMELAADVLLPAATAAAADYDAETARLNATAGMRAYQASLEAVLQAANGATASLRDGLEKSREERRRAASEVARKRASEIEEAQAAARQLAETRARLATLEHAAADLEPIIRAKQDEIVALTSTARQEDQLAVDASKGLDGLGAACGANCESHRGKANAARKRIQTIQDTLAAPTGRRDEAIRQRDMLAAQIVTLRQKAESAPSAHAAAAVAEEEPADIASAARRLALARDLIRADPSWARIREAKPVCEAIVAAMRAAGVTHGGVAAEFDCEPAGAETRDRLTTRDETIAGRAAFERKCSLDGEIRGEMSAIAARIRNAADADKAAAAGGFEDAKKIVDDCIVMAKAAGLTEAEVRSHLERSDIFLRTHSMERNRFELAREAFVGLTPDATMAIGVAVAQDAFMFVMKLLSEIFKARESQSRAPPPALPALDVADSDGEAADLRLMKALLRLSRPRPGGRSAFDAAEIADLPIDVRSNIIGLLNRLVREGIASLDRKGVYLLDNRTLVEVEAKLSHALKRASRGSVAAEVAALTAELGARDGSARGFWRRRRSALDRYLTPRAAPPVEAESEEAAAK